jgi:hypothetical protein
MRRREGDDDEVDMPAHIGAYDGVKANGEEKEEEEGGGDGCTCTFGGAETSHGPGSSKANICCLFAPVDG